ncbi:oligosaccharide flippase family protein [Fictibacillus sp. BK138]|uniref:oligosaccharide flippase family protein n=1 Tax=Fictibacillus sp. BK138 TaxID=2512121 RepID=UPI0010293148|nr:oligosaccharide flippase family protein [Fictibacillus sp. BK138]RZT21373.1 O-antigen/teichoic acid export membrane protein [Fictibacillus sp. BK138]
MKIFKNQLLKKFIAFSIGNWITLLIALISTPIITRILTPEEFGVFSLFTITVNFLIVIATMGLDQSYARYYYDGSNPLKLFYLTLTSSLLISIVFSLILLPWLNVVIKFIFNIESTLIGFLLIFGLIIGILNKFILLLFRMEQKAKLYSLFQVTMKVTELILLIVLYYFLNNHLQNYLIPIISFLLSVFFTTLVGYMFKSSLNIKNLQRIEGRTIKFSKLFRYGFPLAISLIITWLFQYADRFLIKNIAGYNELGIYSAAFKIISILNILQVSFTTFWVPVSNEKFFGLKKNSTDFFKQMFNLVSFVMITLGFVLILFRDFLIYIFGNSYENAIYVFPMLIFIPIMYTISEISVVGINFYKKQKWQIIIAIVTCLLNIILNYLFIPNWGAKGAAISTGISYILFMFLRTIVGNFYFNMNLTLKKFFVSLSLLLIISLIFTFTKTNLFTFSILVISLLVHIFLNRRIVIELKSKIL